MFTATVSCAENITKFEGNNRMVENNKNSVDPTDPSEIEKANNYERISLNLGQSVSTKSGLNITFVAVNDSRCPEGARCIHAGNGAISLKLQMPGVKEESITLNTFQKPGELSYQNYIVKVDKLTPYPGSSEALSASVKQVTLLVTKN